MPELTAHPISTQPDTEQTQSSDVNRTTTPVSASGNTLLPYPPAEAAHMAELLRDTIGAKQILLFGSLTGGTPHSDIAAYDLLVITEGEPRYDEDAARRLLKLKMPPGSRIIRYVNILVYNRYFIENTPSPLFYLARNEGTVLWCDKDFSIKKWSSFDFDTAHTATSRYFNTFSGLADSLLDEAGAALATSDLRRSAHHSAQAALILLRTLFFVFYGFETSCNDPGTLYTRLYTLSVGLMLLFDSGPHTASGTIPHLRTYLNDALTCKKFLVAEQTLRTDLDNIREMQSIVIETCRRRISLYDRKRAQQ